MAKRPRAVRWQEVPGEDEVGERNCKCFELIMFRQHRLVLSPAVLPAGFAGGLIEMHLVLATSGSKLELGSSEHLINFDLMRSTAGRRLAIGSLSSSEEDDCNAGSVAAAAPTATLRVDAAGETGAFGVAIPSYSHARQPPKKFWLKLRWADGPARGADVLSPFRLYILSISGSKLKASSLARRPPLAIERAPAPAAALDLAPPAAPLQWALAAVASLADAFPLPLPPGAAPPALPRKRPPSGDVAPRKRPVRRCAEDAPLPPPPLAAGLDEQFSRLALAARDAEAAPAAADEARPAPCTSNPVLFFSAHLRSYEDRIHKVVLRAQNDVAIASRSELQTEGERHAPLQRDESLPLVSSLKSALDLRWRVPMAHAASEPAGGGPFPSVLPLTEVAAVEAPLRKLHAAARAAGDSDHGPADRLRDALADVRVLATGIVQDELGGVEFKDMLQAVRAARRSDAGPQHVVSALLRAILAREPRSLSREELAAGVQQATAFLECGGMIARDYIVGDLLLLDPPAIDALARHLLECADLLGDPEARARAVAACANSCALVRSPDDDSFVDTLLEAWGRLKRRGLVPSRAEVEVVRALVEVVERLCFFSRPMQDRYSDLRASLFSQLYWYCGDRPRDFLVQNMIRHLIAIDARSRGLQGADRHYEIALQMMSDSAFTRAVRAVIPNNLFRLQQAIQSIRSLNIVKALQHFHEMMEDEKTYRLFHFHSSDWINRLRIVWPLMQPATLVRLLHVLRAVLKMTGSWDETPHSAHLLFALGDVHAAAGDLPRAAAAYDECLQMYDRFGDFFPPDCRRVVAARASLEACRAALATPGGTGSGTPLRTEV